MLNPSLRWSALALCALVGSAIPITSTQAGDLPAATAAAIAGYTQYMLRHTADHDLNLDFPYDVRLYALDIDVDTTAATFDAKVAIFFTTTQPHTAAIELDIGRALAAAEEPPFEPYRVRSVTDLFGRALVFQQDSTAGILRVELRRSLRRDRSGQIVIHYGGAINRIADTGHPYFGVGLVEATSKYGEPIIQTFGWPNHARLWLPCQDHPSDPASWIVNAVIDDDSTLLSNGAQVLAYDYAAGAETKTGRTFVMWNPVPTYALQVIAGDFTEVALGEAYGTPITAYVYPQDTSFIPTLWGRIPASFEYLSDLLGPYAFHRYAMLEVPSAFGGMEHATIVSIADTDVEPDSHSGESTGIHELTHHWFGDNVYQANWQSFWLNESLASFLTTATFGHLNGAADYQSRMNDDRWVTFAYPYYFDDDPLHWTSDQEVPGVATLGSFYAPYYKGPWIWHMIRVILGDQAFFAFLGDYTRDHYFEPYSTDSVLDSLNAYTVMEFDQFFAEWIHQAGWPQVSTTTTYDAATRTVTLTAQQVQDTSRYGTYTLTGPLALQFALDDGDPTTPVCGATVSFAGGSLEETVSFACDSQPTTTTLTNVDDLFVELVE